MFALALLLCLGASVGDEPSTVATDSVELQWDAPASCPTLDEVREEIAALLGEREPTTGSLTVEARVRADGDAYLLQLALRTASGSDVRDLRGAPCKELARATALIVATMVDPLAVVRRIEELEAAATQAGTAADSRTSLPPIVPLASELHDERSLAPGREREDPLSIVAKPPSTQHATASPSPLGVSLRLEGIAGLAALPRIDGGLAVAAGLLTKHLRLEVGAAHLFAQPRAHPARREVGLRVWTTTAIVRGCGVPLVGRWEFPVCGGGELGAMAARGDGSAVTGAVVARSPYANVFAEVHVVWRATRHFGLWVGGQAIVNVARPRFTVGSLDPFFITPIGGGRAKLGVEVRFR
jgi:hypothetical protein